MRSICYLHKGKQCALTAFALLFLFTLPVAGQSIQLEKIGGYETGIFDEGAAEISAFDPISSRLFVINSDAATVDALDLSVPANPRLLFFR